MNEMFNRAFSLLLQIEGGYVDDPDDTGGKTRYGITEAVARRHKYDGDIKSLPLDFAMNIYQTDYWNALNLDKVNSWALCQELFDSSVNVGVKRAASWLQECMNVLNNGGTKWSDIIVDGVIGEKTIDAVNNACKVAKWERRVVKLINCVQGDFYKELCKKRPKSEKFLGGWLDKRVIY